MLWMKLSGLRAPKIRALGHERDLDGDHEAVGVDVLGHLEVMMRAVAAEPDDHRRCRGDRMAGLFDAAVVPIQTDANRLSHRLSRGFHSLATQRGGVQLRTV